MERFLLLPVRLPLPLLHPMRSSRVVRRLTAQSLAPPVRNKTSKTKKKSSELQENASAILETELVSADNSASASGTTMLPTETKVKKPSLKASTGRNASKDRKGETIHSSERGSSGADDTTLRIDKLSTTTEISEEPKLNVRSEAESSSMDKQPSEILQRRRKPPVKAVEPSEKPSPDLSSGDASRLPLENVATRRKQSLDSLSVENTPFSLRGPSELTENSAAAISASSKKKRLVSSDKLSKDGSIASRETVSVESSLSLDKASGRKKKKSEEAIPRLDPQMASLTSEPTRKVLSVEVKELSLSSSSSDSALSSFVEETIPNSPDIASTQLSNSLLKKARKFPVTKQHTVYASPRSRKRAAVAKTPSVGIVEAAKEIDVSKLKHSSFQEVRTVENSVDKASLMESTPSSFSDIHTLNVDAFPRRKRTSLLLDGSASNAPTAQPHVGGEISVSKSDSISHQNFKAERANTKLVEYFATDSSADRQTIKLQSAPVEGARVEGLSLHPSRSLSSMEEISVNQIKKVRSSQNRVLLKKGAEEIHREPNNPLSLAEETASLDLQKAYSKMRSPSTFPTEKQSQRVPVPKAEFSANVERAEGKIKTAPRQLSIRKVVANQASTISYMQIYGTGLDTGDTVPTVLLFFDRRRFIFNAGEGLHRFCIEHKFKLSKIDHIFVTRVCSETTSGLPGLLLTLAGLGDSGMTAQIWGPSNLQDLVNAMRTFVPSGSMVHAHCFSAKEDSGSASSPPILILEDELVKVSAVLLCPWSSVKDADRNRKNFDNRNQEKRADSSTRESVSAEGIDMSVVYICELSKVPGKFDPVKALEKGLRPGIKYGKLQRGESVVSDDGLNMVHPEDVLGCSSAGPIMILIDCPSTSHIPALISAKSLHSFFPCSGKIVNCMVHVSPASVTRCKEYQDWMGNFEETYHIMAGKQGEELGSPILKSSARILSKLNFMCPQVFPFASVPAQNCEKILERQEYIGSSTIHAENLLKFHFRPLTALGPDRSDVPESFDFTSTQEHFMRKNSQILEARDYVAYVWKERDLRKVVGRFNGGLESCKTLQDLPKCLQRVNREEMEVVFLGTGSSQPSKYRNVSAIYIHLFKSGGILLDCGEGTYAQLKRRYGAKGVHNVLVGLKCIWISHIHADHHTGLARLLSARRKLMQEESICEPVLVIGPRQLKRFLEAYEQVEDLHMRFLDCNQTTAETQGFTKEYFFEDQNNKERHDESRTWRRRGGLIHLSLEAQSGSVVKGHMQNLWQQPGFHYQQGRDVAGRENLRSVLQSLGLKDLTSIPVVHCINAFGVVLEAEGKHIHGSEMQPGWKLVYSGDTRPCQALIEASRGATILIHEATFDDSMPTEAVLKNHSLTKEAIEVGVSAGVYRIFLTHFSQRYPKIPVFDERYKDRTCIAFDMMSVNLADMPLLPSLLPPLKLLFQHDSMDEDDGDTSV